MNSESRVDAVGGFGSRKYAKKKIIISLLKAAAEAFMPLKRMASNMK